MVLLIAQFWPAVSTSKKRTATATHGHVGIIRASSMTCGWTLHGDTEYSKCQNNVIVPCVYRGEINSDVKGSVCFVLEFALPPFSLPLPSVVQYSKQHMY